MTLHIHNPEADKLAHELANRTGMSVEQAVLDALREQTRRAFAEVLTQESSEEEILDIIRHCSSLPTYDSRSAEEILGYDENGLPG